MTTNNVFNDFTYKDNASPPASLLFIFYCYKESYL